MITLTKVQAATKAYKNVSAIERAKPVGQSSLESQSEHKHFQPSHDDRKSFADILKKQMQKA
jgi:ribosomal protein L22